MFTPKLFTTRWLKYFLGVAFMRAETTCPCRRG